MVLYLTDSRRAADLIPRCGLDADYRLIVVDDGDLPAATDHCAYVTRSGVSSEAIFRRFRTRRRDATEPDYGHTAHAYRGGQAIYVFAVGSCFVGLTFVQFAETRVAGVPRS